MWGRVVIPLRCWGWGIWGGLSATSSRKRAGFECNWHVGDLIFQQREGITKDVPLQQAVHALHSSVRCTMYGGPTGFVNF
jgi:hypothetical protein